MIQGKDVQPKITETEAAQTRKSPVYAKMRVEVLGNRYAEMITL